MRSFGVGGQERVALDLAIGQRARGHEVSVISLAPPPDGPMAEEFAQAGVAVGRVAKRPGGIDPTLVPRLALELRRRRADVVHTHNPLPLIYGAPAARLVGAAAIHTKHGRNPGGRGHRLLRRAAAQLAHAFVAVSEPTAEQARELGDTPLSKLHTIPNGIRLDRYAPDPAARAAVRAELGLGEAWVVGTVGRLDSYKNQAMLVRAMAPLLSADVRLVLVGDGEARAEVEAAVAALPEPRWAVLTGLRCVSTILRQRRRRSAEREPRRPQEPPMKVMDGSASPSEVDFGAASRPSNRWIRGSVATRPIEL